MYILELRNKLIDLARERIRTGQVTERGLARMCDISQPHMHNVLKNARKFSSESCDRLMRGLGVRIPDLLWYAPEDGEAGIEAVPFLRNRIGPGTGAALTVTRGHLPMAAWLVKGVRDPLMARLGGDLVMPAELAPQDLVMLDQNPVARATPDPRRFWIVDTDAGLRVRYARLAGRHVCIGNEMTRAEPDKWTPVALHRRNILDVVRARIVWIGREMETQTAGPFGPAGESHRSDRRT